MRKTKLSVFFDSLLSAIIIFIISFAILYKKIKIAILCLFICNIISFVVFFAIFNAINKKYNLKNMKLFEDNISKKYLNFLLYSSNEFNNNFFNILLSSVNIQPNIFKNSIAIFYINIKTTLSENDFHIANNYYQNSDKSLPLYFIGTSTTNEFINLLLNSPTKFTLFNFTNIYELMKAKNIFPIEQNLILTKQSKLKQLFFKFTKSLSKHNFFKFLFSGLLLIIISMFIPFSIYYLILGCNLLIFSLICLLSKNNEPIKNETLINLTKKDWYYYQSF